MLLPIVVLVPLLTMSLSLTASWWALMLGHLSALFVAAMVCHGELARDRPSVERLTEFYLLMSVGGAVGGLLNALVAPLVFTSVLEYPIGLLAACLLRPDAVNLIAHPSRWPRDLAWGAVALAAGVAAGWIADSLGIPHAYGAALGLPVLLAITQWPRARRYALLLAAAFVAVQIHLRPLEPALAVDRGFFGVVKVIAMEDGKYHALMHGNILHGLQPVAPPPPGARQRPVSYYAPVRQIFDAQPSTPGTPARSRVGVVGLGIGTLIACGEPHEFWRFYEINPAVVDMARDTRLFRYLTDTPVPHDVVIGEGRLALMREPAHGFDVLILDAFTSDAIPMHLMTREAMSLYFDKLAPQRPGAAQHLEPLRRARARARRDCGRPRSRRPVADVSADARRRRRKGFCSPRGWCWRAAPGRWGRWRATPTGSRCRGPGCEPGPTAIRASWR